MTLRRAAWCGLLLVMLAPIAAHAQSVNIDLGAAGQAGRRSYIPCTSPPWKRATWLVGGSGSE